MVNGLTRKGRPLLNPLQGLRGGKWAGRLSHHGYEELLRDLRRSSEVRRFDKLNSALPLGFILARSHCRVDEDIRVEERLNVHATPLGYTLSCRGAPQTARSIDPTALERAWPDPRARRDSSSTRGPER